MRRGGWFVIAVFASGARLGSADEVRFAPEEGSELERSWSEALDLEVDSLEETLDGNPVDVPFSSLVFQARRAFAVEDVLTAVEGGRATDLERTFGASSLEFDLRLDGEPLGHARGASPCEGSVVRFALDPETGEFERSLEEGGIEDERLARLEPDLDLSALLPAGEVEEGATWELEPLALRRFFAAGGDLGFEPTERKAEMSGVPPEILVAGALGSLHELFSVAEELTGKVEASYAGREESDGPALARIELELEVAAEADLGERLCLLMDDREERSFELSGEIEGKLVVLWDLESGHLRSARFEGDAALAGKLAFPMQVVADHPALRFVGAYELSGEAAVELEVD